MERNTFSEDNSVPFRITEFSSEQVQYEREGLRRRKERNCFLCAD
jgi:hypothetical protein